MDASVYVPSPGDIGLVRIPGAGGRLIRLGQFLLGDGYADFEHAFTSVGDGQVVEAEPSGARLAPLSEYDGAPVVWLRCPPQYGDAVAVAGRAAVGTRYSWLDYFALAAHRLHIPVPGLRTYIKDTRHAMCSQLADLIAGCGGWRLYADGRWEGDVTPGALRELAAKQGEV